MKTKFIGDTASMSQEDMLKLNQIDLLRYARAVASLERYRRILEAKPGTP